MLSWVSGQDNNAPLTGVHIEYAVGYHRPAESETANSPFEHSDRTLVALEAAVSRADWVTMKSAPRGEEATTALPSGDVALVNLTLGTALVPVYPDVAYAFRVKLLNKIGASEPSEVVPDDLGRSGTGCLLPPKPPSAGPLEIKVFGNVPNTLKVVWQVGRLTKARADSMSCGGSRHA